MTVQQPPGINLLHESSNPVGFTTSDTFSSTTTKPARIPRPLNAFFIFRAEVRILQQNLREVERDQRKISRIAGQLWRDLPEPDKRYYYHVAQNQRLAHKRDYPDYRFMPSRKKASSTSKRKKRKVDCAMDATDNLTVASSSAKAGACDNNRPRGDPVYYQDAFETDVSLGMLSQFALDADEVLYIPSPVQASSHYPLPEEIYCDAFLPSLSVSSGEALLHSDLVSR